MWDSEGWDKQKLLCILPHDMAHDILTSLLRLRSQIMHHENLLHQVSSILNQHRRSLETKQGNLPYLEISGIEL